MVGIPGYRLWNPVSGCYRELVTGGIEGYAPAVLQGFFLRNSTPSITGNDQTSCGTGRTAEGFCMFLNERNPPGRDGGCRWSCCIHRRVRNHDEDVARECRGLERDLFVNSAVERKTNRLFVVEPSLSRVISLVTHDSAARR